MLFCTDCRAIEDTNPYRFTVTATFVGDGVPDVPQLLISIKNAMSLYPSELTEKFIQRNYDICNISLVYLK